MLFMNSLLRYEDKVLYLPILEISSGLGIAHHLVFQDVFITLLLQQLFYGFGFMSSTTLLNMLSPKTLKKKSGAKISFIIQL